MDALIAAPTAADPTLPSVLVQARRALLGDGELLRHAADAAGGLAVNLALAGLILAGAIWASRWLSGLATQAIARAHRGRSADATLQTFAASLVRYLVIVVGLVAVLDQLGVKATSVIAVLGAASLAIGLALQGALANVAAGVMILILRPYRVGDRVEIDGRQGIVRGLDLFSTRLSDPDSLNVFIPNAKAFGQIIVNQSSSPARRAQLDFTIGYDDDVDRALKVLLACAAANPQVVAKPEPWAKVTALHDFGVVVTLRAWFSPTDYWDGRFDLLRAVKRGLETQGVAFSHQVTETSRPFVAPRPEARRRRVQPAKAAAAKPGAGRPAARHGERRPRSK